MDWKVLSLHRTLALHGREHVTEETDDCVCNDQPMIRNDCGRVCNVTLGSLEPVRGGLVAVIYVA